MRYSLRTLLIVMAVIAAITGALVNASRPVPITTTVSAKEAIERLSKAESVSIDMHRYPSRYDAPLSPEGKRQLIAWLSEGVLDDNQKNM